MNQILFVIAGIFDMLVVLIYYDSVMKRRSIKGISAMILAAWLGTCFVSYFLDKMQLTGVVLVFSIVSLFGLSFFYKETFVKRLFYSFYVQIIVMVAEAICVILGEISWIKPFISTDSKESIELIVSKILFLFFIIISLLFQRKTGRIPKKHLMYFLFVPIISIVVVHGLANGNGSLWAVSLLGVLAINITVYYILNLLSEYAARILREEMTQEQIKKQRDNYEQLSKAFKKGNHLVHDVNKHMRQIGWYLEHQKWEQASDYLNKVQNTIGKNYSMINSGNIVIDSIISNLKTQIEEYDSKMLLSIHVDISRIEIDDYDLVIILGNISDNILQEVRGLSGNEIYFRIETTENELLIHTKNPINFNTKKREKDPWFHGIGIENIKETVARYGGCFDFGVHGDLYENMILISYAEENHNASE